MIEIFSDELGRKYKIRLIGMQRLYVILLIFLAVPSFAQEGCTDDQATNYDLNAVVNDGSCLYSEINLFPSIFSILPEEELSECSGLIAYGNYFIGINDSGGKARLILIDRATGVFLRKVEILNADNIDWEAITIYEEHIFIGDSGNNRGVRQDLGIYRVPLNEIENDEITAEYFPFSYEDQVTFDTLAEATPYDCEAIILDSSGIHLFTKGWVTGVSRHYQLDWEAGATEAILIDSFDLQGFVTSAYLNEEGVLGFTGIDGAAFFWIFSDYQPGQFFSGNKRKIGLGFLGQNESIFFEKDTAFISSEYTILGPGNIYEFPLGNWFPSALNTPFFQPLNSYPNPFETSFTIDWPESKPGQGMIYDAFGKLVKSLEVTAGENELVLNAPPGIYILLIISKEGYYRQRLVKY